jgi:hypothetical protein
MNTGTVRIRKWTSTRLAAAVPARSRKATLRHRQSGIAAVEFALLAPPLLVIVLGIAQFGWLMANYVMVTNAASSAARYFASQRGTATPYTSTKTQVVTSAAYLATGNLSITTYVNGTQCTSDSDCPTCRPPRTPRRRSPSPTARFLRSSRASWRGWSACPPR